MMPRRTLLAAGLALAFTVTSAVAGEMPGVDLDKLEPSEAKALVQLMKEGACPCEPARSLYDCIVAKSCDRATSLAQFGATKFGQGFNVDEVREAVVRKYFDDNITFSFELADRPSKGAADGRVVMVEFADFQCPHCSEFAKVLSELVKVYPKDVRVVFKQFPLRMPSPSEAAARATWAAFQQDRFWPMHDLIFESVGAVTESKLTAFATELGLNLKKFDADMNSDAARTYVLSDRNEGAKTNLTGTPTLFINGKLYHEDKSLDALKAHVKSILEKPVEKPVK